ncbi:MAG: hypothetical protein ACTHQM_24240 [Thermoanaerobaculia bacterium]
MNLWNNPLFQNVRAEVEHLSRKVRSKNPIAYTAQQLRDSLMVVVGMERVIELFGDMAPEGKFTKRRMMEGKEK